VVIGAPYIERVAAFETEHDSVLIVHAPGVPPSHVTGERVQPVSGRHSEIIHARYRVDLIEFTT